MVLKSTIRKNIINTLKLISSFQKQIEYQENVPVAQVPAELFCQWFDDFYLPEDKTFQETFSKDELVALKEFSSFFDSKGKNLPDTHYVKVWHKIEEWILISKKAEETLDSIRRDRNNDI